MSARTTHGNDRPAPGDRPRTAAPDHALPQVGEVAWLTVVAVKDAGAFLDWGRPKDLLLPFGEQPRGQRPRAGESCLVFIAEDEDGRPFASMKLNEFIRDTADGYAPGASVTLVIAELTDLGVKAVVDHRYWGLLYAEDIFRPLTRGETVGGHVRKLREDGKLDVTLNPPAHVAAVSLSDRVMAALRAAGGFLPLSDKSSPEAIQAQFGVSKGVYKQAIGALYKQRLIRIDKDGIRLAGDGPSNSGKHGNAAHRG